MAKKDTQKPQTPEIPDMEELVGALGAGESGPGDGAREGGDDAGSLDLAEQIARMKACTARMLMPHTFQPGQLIRWKKGLKNKRTPAYGEPIIVIEVLKESVIDQEHGNAGSAYFREPLTIVAGEIDKDGDFICFHYDGRRFEPYKE